MISLRLRGEAARAARVLQRQVSVVTASSTRAWTSTGSQRAQHDCQAKEQIPSNGANYLRQGLWPPEDSVARGWGSGRSAPQAVKQERADGVLSPSYRTHRIRARMALRTSSGLDTFSSSS